MSANCAKYWKHMPLLNSASSTSRRSDIRVATEETTKKRCRACANAAKAEMCKNTLWMER
ncbi:hypothetical protein TcasGA2_TC011083 [Tribolium castaneum]|uniref:Uncharacterized protein n=1 Tax=Tribolium castaneum TaxID=7070 RepID=D6X4E2_TRICA|nr:hypothetical protein TcasGA2_TC011083 [Tribolium castaneum]